MKDVFSNSVDAKNSNSQARKLRVLLWDIDGTLMRSKRRGAFKEYFAPVMKKVFGSSGKISDLQVSGMTDTQIFYESLKEEGFTPEKILEAKSELLPIFKREMTKFVEKNSPAYEVLPGAREVLERTSENPNFHNALLTGNLSVAAELKLKTVGLWKYFENSPGLFGEISHDRRELGKDAVKIFSRFLGTPLKSEQFILIGDTPNDIAAARSFGAKIVSVGTGRNHPPEELLQAQPDALLNDLSDTEKVLQILEEV